MLNIVFLFLQITFAHTNYDAQVNDHLIESSKKIEIQQQKTQTDLEKNSPDYLEYDPPVPRKSPPFVAVPPKPKADPSVYQDQQFTPSTENDPSAQIEQDLQTQRDLANEQTKTREQFIKEFEENAAKAGVKVKIDPNTLKATPTR